MSPPLRWPAEALWEAVAPELPGFTVEVLPEIDSSNTELMRRCRAGQTDPVLVVAELQTAGRGRLGRQWHSPPGSSLTFSLGLPFHPADWSGLSLAVGTSLADSLCQASGADIRIKWPNDLWLAEAKLAGVLVETAGSGVGGPRHVVVGVGINVCAPSPGWLPPASPDAVLPAQPPVWLDSVTGLDAPAVLHAVVPPLVRDLLRFEREGFAALAPRFARRDLLAGREVRLSDGRQGRALGVSPTGALRLQVDGAVEDVLSADVSVRPGP
jgi:BirA family biotin operon repressor/biotin-[acetyl-CoA-carboxylase] ligase